MGTRSARSNRNAALIGVMVGALALFVGQTPSLAQPFPPPPDFGLDWVTVGAPGNEPVPDELYIETPPPAIPLGTVDYEYRILRTEITIAQWFEFVLAYAPYFEGAPSDPAFTGQGINFILGSYVQEMPDDFPTRASWEFAARYANWLHNNKAPEQAAFENGVYDTSTFTRNEDATMNHQDGHHPGALFWIPTHDEWVKAVHYDPDRFGPGVGGWWYNPGSQDELLISGPPGVGQTNAGANGEVTPVASYPEVLSPWGLLDASGGENEWTETISHPIFGMFRRGSDAGDSTYDRDDPVDSISNLQPPTNPFIGVRLASAVQIPACPGDANNDGEVNFADVNSVLGNWLRDGNFGGDANNDGVVDFNDINTVLGNWQAPCP